MRWMGLVLISLSVMFATASGCGRAWPYVAGDPTQRVNYDNQFEETVTIRYRWDDTDLELESMTLPPHSRGTSSLPLRSTGFTVKGITASGALVLNRHYLWSDLSGRALDIAIAR